MKNVNKMLYIVTVIPAGAIQISSGEGGQGIHTLTMTNSPAGGAIVQYAQGQEFYVPGIVSFLLYLNIWTIEV